MKVTTAHKTEDYEWNKIDEFRTLFYRNGSNYDVLTQDMSDEMLSNFVNMLANLEEKEVKGETSLRIK